jgi:hypothetical protein
MGDDLMDADWSVELGADDDALEFPWASPDGSQSHLDLQRHPELLAEIPEAAQFPELAGFLCALNGPESQWLSAKCDVWIDGELGEAEAIHDAKLKLCSYVDLIFRYEDERFCFDRHEQWVKSAARELSVGGLPVACEFIVRRCWYRPEASDLRAFDDTLSPGGENLQPGFYITFYLFGYGANEHQARERWGEGLRRVTSVLAQLAT